MSHYLFALLLLTTGMGARACKETKTPDALSLDPKHTLLLLDSTRAADAILRDTFDHFFDRVTLAEMSIQMKKPVATYSGETAWREAYRQFIRTEMSPFSEADKAWITGIVRDVFAVCQALNPDIFPDTLLIIQSKTNHYGQGVYYTRANCIIVPQDAVADRNAEAFRSTMLHELFHVYSRLHPGKRRELYALIGFESMEYEKLQLPEKLRGRVLHNPDGVNFAQKIRLLQPDGRTITAVPIIYAGEDGFTSGKKEFFAYLNFQLFEAEPMPGSDRWQVVCKDDGISSTLDLKNQADFYRQIRDNTGYIIHPDEVLADNFTFLMESKTNPARLNRFSEPGKALIRKLEEVLTP